MCSSWTSIAWSSWRRCCTGVSASRQPSKMLANAVRSVRLQADLAGPAEAGHHLQSVSKTIDNGVYSRKQASGGSDEGTLFCVIGCVGNRDGDGVVGARVGRSPVSVCCAGQGGASQGGAGQ